MKGKKGKGKGLKGIAMAASVFFVVAIVLLAFSSTASASLINRTFTPTGGVINYEGGFAQQEVTRRTSLRRIF